MTTLRIMIGAVGLLFWSGVSPGPAPLNEAENARLFKAMMSNPSKTDADIAAHTVEAGRALLGQGYVAKALELIPEQLFVNLQAVDCMTFVEYALSGAFERKYRSPEGSFSKFLACVRELRYRGGVVAGYASRLHYMGEWLHQATQNGHLEAVTNPANAREQFKLVNYMSSYPSKYPALADAATLAQIKEAEIRISANPMYFWTASEFRGDLVRDGDLVLFLSNVGGLDYAHCGISVGGKLMHASQTQRRVVITAENIADYLKAHKQFQGVSVYRVTM